MTIRLRPAALAVLAMGAGVLSSTAYAGIAYDRHGNTGYDTAQECDAAVLHGTAQFYRSVTHKKPLLRKGEASVRTMKLSEVDARYVRGACDIGIGRKLDRDGVGVGLVGKYVPYSPQMEVNAYQDKGGNITRISMHQCDNWFSDVLPRPVALPPPPPPVAVAPPPPPPAPVPPPPAPVPPPPPAPVAAVAAPMLKAASSLNPYVFGGLGLLRDGGDLVQGDGLAYTQSRLAGQLGAGVQINSWLGLEAVGQLAKQYSGYNGIKTSDFGARLTVGTDLGAGVRVFGKLGMASVHHSGSGVSGNQTRPTIGLGMLYDLGSNLDLRLDYDHIFNRGSSYPSWKSADYFGAGVQYNFK